jgi:hypothetical protein
VSQACLKVMDLGLVVMTLTLLISQLLTQVVVEVAFAPLSKSKAYHRNRFA